jgi:hypothetical protein
MSRFIQALLSGIFFTFIIDFFIFLGIKQNYIDFYNIDLYYNILFADNQNIFIFMAVSIIFGFLIIYLNNIKLTLITIGIFFVLSLSTLIEPIGYKIGEMMLMKKDINLYDAKYHYNGDIYYNGRKELTFYDNELKKL